MGLKGLPEGLWRLKSMETSANSLSALLDRICSGAGLSRDESRGVFARIAAGELSDIEIAAFLAALRTKGEKADEIAGAAEALLESAVKPEVAGMRLCDTCGTGGDGAGSFNISTAAAVVAAEAGLLVAKHGNRSVSSKCGSADVLEKCGVKMDAGPAAVVKTLKSLGICFMFAPLYHPGMKYAMPARRALGVRTIFNVLGPLVNPARPSCRLTGVYHPSLCRPVAETLSMLGCGSALVVHGSGLDEVAIHAETTAARLSGGAVEMITITPEGAGLVRRRLEETRGGGVEENAGFLRDVLEGRDTGARSEAAALNAGALMWIAGRSADLKTGVEEAMAVIRSGKAADRLSRWAEISNDP
jgi:anthranilate phosphoribosyltransferase